MKKLTVKKAWLAVCMACIILFCLTFLLYAFYMKDSVNQLELESNRRDATYAKLMLDSTWDDLKTASIKRYYDSRAQTLESAKTIEEYESLGAYSFMIGLKEAVQQDPFIEDIMYYYPQTDYIVGRFGVYKAKTYWLAASNAMPKTVFTQWKTKLFVPGQTEAFLTDDSQDHCIYFRACRMDTKDRILVIQVNMQEVERRLEWVNQNADNRFISIMSANGQVVSYAGDYEAFVSSDSNRMKTLGSQYIVTQLDASIRDMQYYSVSEKSEVCRLSSHMISIAGFLMAGVFIVCVSIASMLIRLYTKPIEMISGIFQNNTEQKQNELETIDTGIQRLLKKQDELLDLANQQQMILGQSFLNELLFQNPGVTKNAETVAAFYGLSLTNDCFCIVACRRSENISADKVQEFLSNLEDLDADVFWTEKEDIEVFLLNFDSENASTPACFAEKLRSGMQLEARIVLSQTVNSYLLIPGCWKECASRLGVLSFAPELPGNSERSQAEMILDDVSRKLYSRDFSTLQRMAPVIFDNCIRCSDELLFACNKYSVVRMLYPYSQDAMGKALTELAQTDDRNTWISLFRYVLDVCESNKQSRQDSDSSDVAQNVREIIELHYNNPALDLRMISEMAGFSQPHVSKLFKEKYAVSIAQFINQTRIRHAKEMLINGNDNIKVIALRVGFTGDTQFIRAFKRVESVTPGSLRSKAQS